MDILVQCSKVQRFRDSGCGLQVAGCELRVAGQGWKIRRWEGEKFGRWGCRFVGFWKRRL